MEDKDNKTIFLMCTERSGSNLITKLLNAHSKISGPSTKHIINPLARNFFRYLPFNEGSWNQLIDDLLTLYEVDFSFWDSEFTKDEILANLELGDVYGLVKYFFNKEAGGKPISFIKEIKLHEFYPFINKAFSNSYFLYQVRDPRDVALSWKKDAEHKGGLISASKQWKQDQQRFLQIHHIHRFSVHSCFIKYEDLVSEPRITLKPFFSMINQQWEDRVLEYYKDPNTIKNAIKLDAWKNLSSNIMDDNFGKYKNELNDEEIMFIERICYFEMKQLGYMPEYSWDYLKTLSEQDISIFSLAELESLDYSPSEGVKANMKAKKRFYER